MSFKSLRHIVDLCINGNWHDALDYVNSCISTDILINEELEHLQVVNNSNNQVPITFKPIFTAERIMHDSEELRMQSIPNFSTQEDRNKPENQKFMVQLAESYINFTYKLTKSCSNSPFEKSGTKRYVLPITAFREYINSKRLANLPHSVDYFLLLKTN